VDGHAHWQAMDKVFPIWNRATHFIIGYAVNLTLHVKMNAVKINRVFIIAYNLPVFAAGRQWRIIVIR